MLWPAKVRSLPERLRVHYSRLEAAVQDDISTAHGNMQARPRYAPSDADGGLCLSRTLEKIVELSL